MYKVLMASTFLFCQLGSALAQAPAEAGKMPEAQQQQQQPAPPQQQPAPPQQQAENQDHSRRELYGREDQRRRGPDFDNGYERGFSGGQDRELRDDDYGQRFRRNYGYRDDREFYRRRDDQYNRRPYPTDRYRGDRYGSDDERYDRQERFRGPPDDQRRSRVRICIEDDEGNMFCRLQSNRSRQRMGL